MANVLSVEKTLEIRFSEVDSMNVVWHGSYMLYFEDAREAFGNRYGLKYMTFFDNDCYAPLVDMNFHWRKPIRYGQNPVIRIIYVPTEAAKIVFKYQIIDPETDEVMAYGDSTQIFMDLDYQLMWECPDFYKKWQEEWGVFK